MRWLRELDTTTCPACAKACSISVATEASIEEKTKRGAFPGLQSSTVRSATPAGIAPSRRQLVASRYLLPAERSLAPAHFKSNQGWFSNNLANCWPTMPVAPNTPTSIFCCMTLHQKIFHKLLIKRYRIHQLPLR